MKITSFIYQLFIFLYRISPFKKAICFFIKYCNIPNDKFYKDLFFYGSFKIKLQNKKLILQNIKATIENEIFWKGIYFGWEKDSINIWEKLSRKSEFIFDIGANTGIYSLISCNVNPSANVYAFEPVERTFNVLTLNKKNNNFTKLNCYNLAISNKDGESVFYDVSDINQYSASLNNEMLGNVNVVEIIVPVKSLKTFLTENNIPRIDILKIDVEMHEPEVLEGMGDLIELYKPDFLIEILTDEIGSKIQKCFSPVIYDFFMIDEKTKPEKVFNILKSECYNYLICKKETSQFLNLL